MKGLKTVSTNYLSPAASGQVLNIRNLIIVGAVVGLIYYIKRR